MLNLGKHTTSNRTFFIQQNLFHPIEPFYSNPYHTVLNIKNCISKSFTEIYIKRKTRAGKTYAYGMLLSSKAS